MKGIDQADTFSRSVAALNHGVAVNTLIDFLEGRAKGETWIAVGHRLVQGRAVQPALRKAAEVLTVLHLLNPFAPDHSDGVKPGHGQFADYNYLSIQKLRSGTKDALDSIMGAPPMVRRIVITDTVAIASMGDGWGDPVQVAVTFPVGGRPKLGREFLTSEEAGEEKEEKEVGDEWPHLRLPELCLTGIRQPSIFKGEQQ